MYCFGRPRNDALTPSVRAHRTEHHTFTHVIEYRTAAPVELQYCTSAIHARCMRAAGRILRVDDQGTDNVRSSVPPSSFRWAAHHGRAAPARVAHAVSLGTTPQESDPESEPPCEGRARVQEKGACVEPVQRGLRTGQPARAASSNGAALAMRSRRAASYSAERSLRVAGARAAAIL